MAFFGSGRIRNDYDIFKGYSYYVPTGKGVFALLGLFILGMILGIMVQSVLGIFMSERQILDYGMIVVYPVQFLPAMVYTSLQSRKNAFFGNGIRLDNRHFAPLGGALAVLLCIVGTLALSMATDWINWWNLKITTVSPFLAKFYEIIKMAMQQMTGGPLWSSILVTGLMAAFFEEWLCRGEVLRGLLQKMKPTWAILVSALFFAVIHGNPWQALNAFIIGCVLGYIYYRTGSLVLTMIMHATNNITAVILSHIDSLKDVEFFKDIMDPTTYGITSLVSVIVVAAVLFAFSRIPLRSPEGNCDEVSPLAE